MYSKILLIASLLLTLGVTACQPKKMEQSSSKTNSDINLKASDFQTTINGKQTNLYKLHNKNGIKVDITNYGGRIVSILTPDKNGNFDDIVLGHDSIDGYLNGKNNYFGALIGRFANRIAKGKFTLDGKNYQIPVNNGQNSLHGGNKGFDSRVWDAKQLNDQNLLLTYDSKDGEEGYPGNLKLQVLYTLRDDNVLSIDYAAVTDKKTVVNFTNHSYFNLDGAGSAKINDHLAMINADQYTPIDSTMIPTGKLEPVKGTPFDFTQPTAFGKRINEDNQQLKYAHGYDDNWVLNKPKAGMLTLAAKVYSPQSGRAIEAYTTEPGIQVYTGNFLDGSTKGIGGTYNYRSAFTLETQHFPDSPNQDNFPSTVLKPGQIFRSLTEYHFTTVSDTK